MSSQKGNSVRKRPQKHQNSFAFKNNLHDTSHRIKLINSIQVEKVCAHCKAIIEWKIKYKKYKPLSQMRACVRCHEKCIKSAYHVICTKCAQSSKSCAKCLETVDITPISNENNTIDDNVDIQNLIKELPERKRRTLLRLVDKSVKDNLKEEYLQEHIEKLKALVFEDNNSDDLDDPTNIL